MLIFSKHSLSRCRAGIAVLGLIIAGLANGGPARAALLFDTGPGNNTTFRLADSGPGQGIAVTTTTQLTNFAIDLNLPQGGDIRYMIWDATNTNLLFSEVQAVSASSTPSFVLSAPFSFTLNAGSTYYFGVIADANMDVQYIFPEQVISQNGLTALMTGNSNYVNFANPSVTTSGSAEITLELFGTQGPTTVPEPSSLVTLGASLLGLFGFVMLRRRDYSA